MITLTCIGGPMNGEIVKVDSNRDYVEFYNTPKFIAKPTKKPVCYNKSFSIIRYRINHRLGTAIFEKD